MSLAIDRTLGVEDLGDFIETTERDLVQNLISKLSEHHDTVLTILIADVIRSYSNDLPISGRVIRVDYLNDRVVRIFNIERRIYPVDDVS